MPTLSGAQLLAMAPGIERLAELEIDEWATMAAAHLTVGQLWALRQRIAHHVARPEVDGIVVTHGTDTLEESAYLASRSISTAKPVVFTGAMRTADEPSWDGPANLMDAVRVAASPRAQGYGMLVVFADRIFAAADATKVHTYFLEAFESPDYGPIGVVDGDSVVFERRLALPERILVPERLASPVDIVYAYAGGDGRLLDGARTDGVGVVVAALGRGNTNPPFFEAVCRWLSEGKPVVVTSRAFRGRVSPSYGFRGGGRSLLDAGAIFARGRRPQQARLDLMLALGAGLVGADLAAVFEA